MLIHKECSSWFVTNELQWELSDVLQGRCYYGDSIIEATNVPNLYLIPTFGIGGSLKLYAETKISEEPMFCKI